MLVRINKFAQDQNILVMFWIAFIFGIVGTIGVVFTIIQFFGSQKTDFTIKLIRSERVYQQDSSFPDLKVLYREIEVNSLFKTYYLVENTGAKSYSDQNVKDESVYIKFDNINDVFVPEIIDKRPNDISVDAIIDRNNKKIYIKSSLMNSGDKFILGVTSKNPPHVNSVGGRVDGITNIVFDKTSHKFNVENGMVLFMCLATILFSFSMFYQAVRLWREKNSYSKMETKLFSGDFNNLPDDLNDLKRSLDSQFNFINRSGKEKIIAFVDGIQNNLESENEKKIVSNVLERIVKDWRFDKYAFWGSILFFMIFFALGASLLFLVLNKLLFD